MVEQTEGANNRDMPTASFLAADLGRPALDALARATEWYAKTLLSWQGEIVRFATARLDSDVEFGRSVMNCRNWTEASRLQQDWAVSTLNDYADEANRLVQLATGQEKEGADIMRRAMEEETEAAAGAARRGMRGARRAAGEAEEEIEEAAERTAKEARSTRPRRAS
jgi:hypothetical protein